MDDEVQPSQSFLYSLTRENAIEIADRLHALWEQGRLQYVDVVKRCLEGAPENLKSAQERFSRWRNNVKGIWDRSVENDAWKETAWKILSAHEFHAVVTVVLELEEGTTSDDTTSLQDTMPDLLFHGMRQWRRCTLASLRDLNDHFPGVYAIYRHSRIEPGNVLIGRLTITSIKDTRVVKTKEEYRIPGTANRAEKKFELDGYIFRKNKYYNILSKHKDTGRLQTLYLYEPLPRGGLDNERHTIATMSGVVFDAEGHNFYATRFMCERADAANPPAIQIKAFKDLPNNIKEELKRKIPVENGVVKF